MDSFEAVVAAILQRQGYWTQSSVKVEITKAEKRQIGLPSAPRWELDVVAYRGASNELLVVECKSLLDSPGVPVATFKGLRSKGEKRYKLFFNEALRRVVLGRLESQFVGAGFCRPRPSIVLGLAAGRINGDVNWLADYFASKGWRLWGPAQIRAELELLKESRYENSVATLVAKLILRNAIATPSNTALRPTNRGQDRAKLKPPARGSRLSAGR